MPFHPTQNAHDMLSLRQEMMLGGAERDVSWTKGQQGKPDTKEALPKAS